MPGDVVTFDDRDVRIVCEWPPGKSAERFAELERELVAAREALTSVHYARMLDRFHALDGIKDDSCPCCGAHVEVIEGAEFEGELSPHGTEIPPDTVRLRARRGWKR